MNKVYDVLIIGAGAVGSCLASDLARSGYSVCLVDRANDVATGASKANSGLVHAGFDAKEGTLKAKLNVEGNRMYPSMCKRLSIPLSKRGAVVIGSNKEAVETLYKRGLTNGVKNLQVLNRSELLKLLPNLASEITIGLYAKDAYIVSPYLLTVCLAEEAIVNGATVLLNFNISSIKKENGIFVTLDANQQIYSKRIINCAGAGVNDVAKLIGSEKYDIEFRRGEYYVLDHSEENLTPLTVFPLPSKTSKGVLITPTIDGNILVGPTSYESDKSTKTTLSGLNSVKERAFSLLNGVNLRKSIRNFAGVRCIVGDDFVIENSKKVDSVTTLAGICSPGLSATPAISKYVFSLMGLKYNPTLKTKTIEPYFLFKDLSTKAKNELIKKNKAYGKLVCKCENITEGDILFALSRPLKINSIDAVKRRVRAGMGRCQGGFCKLPVAEIISKKLKLPLEEVLKENSGSNIAVSSIRGGK